jgi:hypothetical protein
MWGAIGLVVVVIAVFAYTTILKPAPQLDPSKVSAERLRDPDRPRGAR